MTENELRMQIALGLIDPTDIDPWLIWNLKDSIFIHQLAELFYNNLLSSWRSLARPHNSVYLNKYRRIHEQFLNNPNTNLATRKYINSVINHIMRTT